MLCLRSKLVNNWFDSDRLEFYKIHEGIASSMAEDQSPSHKHAVFAGFFERRSLNLFWVIFSHGLTVSPGRFFHAAFLLLVQPARSSQIRLCRTLCYSFGSYLDTNNLTTPSTLRDGKLLRSQAVHSNSERMTMSPGKAGRWGRCLCPY